jgi:hypothetical protein
VGPADFEPDDADELAPELAELAGVVPPAVVDREPLPLDDPEQPASSTTSAVATAVIRYPIPNRDAVGVRRTGPA